MIRALPQIALAALALAGAGCQPVLVTDSGEPLVGRLQFQDRLVDLTVDSFADGPQAVPRNSVAEIMADIDPSSRRERAEPAHDDDDDDRAGSPAR